MRLFHTVILLAVPFLAVGCLPMTPGEMGERLLLVLGFSCVLTGLGYSSKLLKVEENKTAARFILGALFLIGGSLIALGARLAGWWGQ